MSKQIITMGFKSAGDSQETYTTAPDAGVFNPSSAVSQWLGASERGWEC